MVNKLSDNTIAKTALEIGIKEASKKLKMNSRKVKYIVTKTGYDKKIRDKKCRFVLFC